MGKMEVNAIEEVCCVRYEDCEMDIVPAQIVLYEYNIDSKGGTWEWKGTLDELVGLVQAGLGQ